jgi:septum formation protein
VRLVLASRSPRREDLLRAAGFVFDIEPADVDEAVLPGERPADCAIRLASAKAQVVAARRPGDVVLGADTVVIVNDVILGKPDGTADAERMLRQLSGRTHEVVTGVALCQGAQVRTAAARTLVDFAQLTEEDLAWYLATGEPADKAGAYGVQGGASRFVTRINGSYSNVVGLPVAMVTDLLRMVAPLQAFTAGG